MSTTLHHGVVHGRIIEFQDELGIPDGQTVRVAVSTDERIDSKQKPDLERLKRAAGGWSEDGALLDEFLSWNRQQRKCQRREVDG